MTYYENKRGTSGYLWLCNRALKGFLLQDVYVLFQFEQQFIKCNDISFVWRKRTIILSPTLNPDSPHPACNGPEYGTTLHATEPTWDSHGNIQGPHPSTYTHTESGEFSAVLILLCIAKIIYKHPNYKTTSNL
jgi:hypothetical protein